MVFGSFSDYGTLQTCFPTYLLSRLCDVGSNKKKRKIPNDIGEWGRQINTELFLFFGSTTSVSSRKKDKYFLSPIAKKAEMKF